MKEIAGAVEGLVTKGDTATAFSSIQKREGGGKEEGGKGSKTRGETWGWGEKGTGRGLWS